MAESNNTLIKQLPVPVTNNLKLAHLPQLNEPSI